MGRLIEYGPGVEGKGRAFRRRLSEGEEGVESLFLELVEGEVGVLLEAGAKTFEMGARPVVAMA